MVLIKFIVIVIIVIVINSKSIIKQSKENTRSYYRKESAASPPRDGSMRILLNKGCLYDPSLPGRNVRRDDFDVLKWVTVHAHSAKNIIF